MGSFSLVHWLVFGVIAILLLGGGRFSNMMGDVAKGIKEFKKGMASDDDAVSPTKPATRLEAQRPAETLDRDADRVREDR